MSHPAAHTLEHIEKQQRSTTPQPGLPSHVPQQPQPPSTPSLNNVGARAPASSRSKKQSKSSAAKEDSVVSALTSVSQELKRQANRNASDTNGSPGFLRIDSPGLNTSASLSNNQTNNIASSGNPIPLTSLFGTESAPLVRFFLSLYATSVREEKYVRKVLKSFPASGS